MGKPGVYDIDTLIAAGINPKNGLPNKLGNAPTKTDIKKLLRIKDEQTAVNRYVWYNLPCDLSSQELERLLYYKGQLCFFYMSETDNFYFMPYALEGTIDFYGRYNSVHPVPMSDGTTDDDKKRYQRQLNILSQKHLTVVKGMTMPDQLNEDMLNNSCVILRDYTNQLSQLNQPRQQLNDSLLDVMADCVPFMRTNLLLSTGVGGIRVNNADEQSNVSDANKSMYDCALNGEPYTPIVGAVDFQALNNGSAIESQQFMMAMQSLDNFRLSLYGLDNNGVFEKQAHVLMAEQTMNSSNNMLVYQDGLSIRQTFCLYANAIWGTSIWCEPSENALLQDLNGDGLAIDENQDGSNAGIDDQQRGDDEVVTDS